jgi:hypothetical protein
MPATVWGFFYGGLINPKVMEKVGLAPLRQELASLSGFDLEISPLVNLVPRYGTTVFGLLLETTHEQLVHVYGQLKARYHPFPVVANELGEGRLVPSLCYIVPSMPPAQADASHIAPLLEAGELLGFPDWYMTKIRSYLPGTDSPGTKLRA